MEDDPSKEFSAVEPQQAPSKYEELEDDHDIDVNIDDDMEEDDFDSERKSAIVINVQSWAIPIVGLLMLLVGIVFGYAGRAILPSLGLGAEGEPAAPEGSVVESTSIPAGELAALPTTTQQQPSAEDMEQLMAFLVSQTKHFKGEADAPVTIIEFSDFQ